MDWTSTGLISSIRRRASIPAAYSTGSLDADLLALINEELQAGLVSDIISIREGHFLRSKDFTISATKTRYRIPPRAIGGRIRLLQLLDGNGKILMTLGEISPERLFQLSSSTDLYGYYIENNEVVLAPGSTSSAVTLRMIYLQRPSEVVLISDSSVKVITSVSYSSPTLTITKASHGFTTASVMDVVRVNPPLEGVIFDTSPVAAATNTLDFTVTNFETGAIAAGDYLCTSDKSIVPQIPDVYWPVLSQRVVCAWLKAKGKATEWASATKQLEELEKKAIQIISPRNESSGKKIIPKFSFLGNVGFNGTNNRGYGNG